MLCDWCITLTLTTLCLATCFKPKTNVAIDTTTTTSTVHANNASPMMSLFTLQSGDDESEPLHGNSNQMNGSVEVDGTASAPSIQQKDQHWHAARTTSSSSFRNQSTSSYTPPRSMYASLDSNSINDAHKHSEVRQRSLRAARSRRSKGLMATHSSSNSGVGFSLKNDNDCGLTDDDALMEDTWNKFVGGDFSSGKIRHISTEQHPCWVIAYSNSADILAIGLDGGKVDFLETRHYTRLYRLENHRNYGNSSSSDDFDPFMKANSGGRKKSRGMISAIEWCPEEAYRNVKGDRKTDHPFGRGELVAISDLEGNVSVHHIDCRTVEFEGVQQRYEVNVGAQVRCLALKRFHNPNDKTYNSMLVLAVGNTNGQITICTLYPNGNAIASLVTLDVANDAIVGLDIHPETMLLAYSTKKGHVVAQKLQWEQGDQGWRMSYGEDIVWSTIRNGAVRAVTITDDGRFIAFGGYDKHLVLVDTNLFAIVHELGLQGTINTIAFDPLDRYYAVGCRDRSITMFDSSTFKPVKRLSTPGWVTSISWGLPSMLIDVVAVRSEREGITLLDMTPIHMMDQGLSAGESSDVASTSWSSDGRFLASLVGGDSIRISDSSFAFQTLCDLKIADSFLRCIMFSPVFEDANESNDSDEKFSLLASVGLDGFLRLFRYSYGSKLQLIKAVHVEVDLWCVAWSSDGKQLAVGGKNKTLYLYHSPSLTLKVKRDLNGRIWDLAFKPTIKSEGKNEVDGDSTLPSLNCDLAVGSGEYKALVFDDQLVGPVLEVSRERTVRCIGYHPTLPNLAIGDGSGTVIIVNYSREDIIGERNVGGRVNVVSFSPVGDFLIVGTDDSKFVLFEMASFKVVQEFKCQGFAVAASFSPSGRHLVLGPSSEDYKVVKLGALLGIDHLPLATDLPEWALQQTLFRSGYGPSLIQRYMINGKQSSMKWVASALKKFPYCIYAFDRQRDEGCFATALRYREMKILQLAITTIVDGSLDAENDRQSILTTEICDRAWEAIQWMVQNSPPEYILAILNAMTFVKVPFTKQHLLRKDQKLTSARSSFLDPWGRFPFRESTADDGKYTVRTAAVLPIPGLGSKDFLSCLISKAPPEAFDNEAMAVVVKVMWKDYIRKYFLLDMIFFISYYTIWIFLIDRNWSDHTAALATTLLFMNTILLGREILQSNFQLQYVFSVFNQIDIISVALVYGYTIPSAMNRNVSNQVPLAVLTTLLLTVVSKNVTGGTHQ
jgi:WD40 repeat protein